MGNNRGDKRFWLFPNLHTKFIACCGRRNASREIMHSILKYYKGRSAASISHTYGTIFNVSHFFANIASHF